MTGLNRRTDRDRNNRVGAGANPGGPVTVRPCRVQDLPEVLALLEQLGEVSGGTAGLTLENTKKTFHEMERLPALYLNLVAVACGMVDGFASVVFYKTLFHAGGTALINELVVDRRVRGRGAGRLLLERVKEEAAARGMDEIEVGTERANRAALKFYRGNGLDRTYYLLGMELPK